MRKKPKSRRWSRTHEIIKPFEDFVSPIDQKIIKSRRQLASHNERHGVTNSSDFSPAHAKKMAQRNDKAFKRERKQDIINNFKLHEQRGR